MDYPKLYETTLIKKYNLLRYNSEKIIDLYIWYKCYLFKQKRGCHNRQPLSINYRKRF